jgi:hypothetical protein
MHKHPVLGLALAINRHQRFSPRLGETNETRAAGLWIRDEHDHALVDELVHDSADSGQASVYSVRDCRSSAFTFGDRSQDAPTRFGLACRRRDALIQATNRLGSAVGHGRKDRQEPPRRAVARGTRREISGGLSRHDSPQVENAVPAWWRCLRSAPGPAATTHCSPTMQPIAERAKAWFRTLTWYQGACSNSAPERHRPSRHRCAVRRPRGR